MLFACCEKTYGIEVSLGPETTISINVGQTEDVYFEQDILLRQMTARNQVTEVGEYKGVYTISFRGGENARFSDKVFPFIQLDKRGDWLLSKSFTGIEAQRDEKGRVHLPSLSISENGFWTLDSLLTDVSAEPYLDFLSENGNDSLNVKGFALLGDSLIVYLSDDSIHRYSIIEEGFYLVPDYWMDSLVTKEKKIEAAIAESEGDYAAFVVFTDAHWGNNYKRSPALIRHITDFTPVSDVFFGGDVITDKFGSPVSAVQLGKDFQESFAFLGPHFYGLFGNHDDNSNGQVKNTDAHLSEQMVISFLQSQMTEVDRKDVYNFYFNDPVSKTRFIGLDTGRYYQTAFRVNVSKTARFLVEALEDVPEGWHIVFLSHIWAEYRKGGGVEVSILTPFYNRFLQIIDDYNARKKGVFRYNEEMVEYDFTGGTAHAICCIGGHTHLNSTLSTTDGLPVIIVGTDGLKKSKVVSQGTANEQCIAILVLDYRHRLIKLFCVGYGEDRLINMPLQ